jgi:quinohemoprotein ethanol dehydrogenase
MTNNSGASSSVRAIVLTVIALAFAGAVLSGCGGSSNEASSPPPPPETTATETGGGQATTGAQLFSDNCESCHGANGTGGHVGPDLQKSSVAESLPKVEKQVREGKGVMPSFANVLSAEEIDTVAHYVVEQIAPKG